MDQSLAKNLKRLKANTQSRIKAIDDAENRRQLDALRLYVPMPTQAPFHESKATVRIIRKGNRAGGSTATFVEVARAFRGMDPWKKYRNAALNIWVIVFEEDNIGRTVFRMLFKPGLFKIIRDLETGKWRAWNPENPSDLDREREAKPAPPLVPKEEVTFAWVKKGPRIFKLARHKATGSEIRTFCSGSEPPMGDPVDMAVIDEDLKQDRKMISELQARLADYEGKLVWAVWPKSKNDALKSLTDQAEEQVGMPNPDVVQFRLNFDQNVFIPKRSRDRTLRLWAAQGEDVMRSRNTGDYMLDAVLMYPEFSMDIHGVPNVIDPDCLDRSAYEHNIDWFLRTRKVPEDWTRFMYVDPGISFTAALFLAVPPPELGDWVVGYDEIYLANRNLEDFTVEVQKRTEVQSFYRFVSDWHYARQREWTSGKSRVEQMMECFKRKGIRSVSTGHGFGRGSDDVPGRISMVHSWLAMRRTAEGLMLAPKFRLLRSKTADGRSCCPNFERETSLYKKVFSHDEATDKPIEKDNHQMNNLEYAAHDPAIRYRRPTSKTASSPKATAMRAFLSGSNKRQDKEHFHLGPGPVPSGN